MIDKVVAELSSPTEPPMAHRSLPPDQMGLQILFLVSFIFRLLGGEQLDDPPIPIDRVSQFGSVHGLRGANWHVCFTV